MDNLAHFDYSFLRGPYPSPVQKLLQDINALVRQLEAYRQEQPAIYHALEEESWVRAMQYAWGDGAAHKRDKALAQRSTPPVTDRERAMAGYREALYELRLGCPPPSPCRRDLLRLHQLLFAPLGVEAGRFRAEESVYQAMEQWESAVAQAQADPNIPALALAPCALLDFLHIDPFAQGGEPMSFLVARLLLPRQEAPLAWEEQARRYQAFYRQSAAQPGYWSFATCVLSLLYLGLQQAHRAFAVLPGQKLTKKNRIEATVLGSPVPISKGEVCRLLPDVSPTTVEAALGILVKDGKLLRLGPARTARYIRAAD